MNSGSYIKCLLSVLAWAILLPATAQISADTLGAQSIQIAADSTEKPAPQWMSSEDTLADNTKAFADTSGEYPSHSPKKAMFLSMAFPGLGQIYNKKYWKLPIIYGLGGTLVYFIIENGRQFNIYGDSYLASIDSTSGYTNHFPKLTPEQIRVGRDYYRRWRDLDVILLIMLYGANIVDALVDGHMKSFDVSDKLTLRVKPDLYIDRFRNTSAGLSFTFQFK